jgi:hypothetical protein
MRQLAPVLTTVLMCVAVCSGCAVTKDVYMVGVFANGQYIDMEAMKVRPDLNKPITLDHETVYKVKDAEEDTKCTVLVGWESPGVTQAKIKIIQPHPTDDPVFRVNPGWMYMAGYWPMACTARVEAVPHSTKAVLQVVGDGGSGKPHRVYLRDLQGDQYLEVKLGAQARHLDTPGWHVTSPTDGVLDQPVETTGSEATFAQAVEVLVGQVPIP